MYTFGQRCMAWSIKGASVDSKIPMTLIHRSMNLVRVVFSRIRAAIVFLNIARASRGTPGRQNSSVCPLALIITAGAVPTGLATAMPCTGKIAILRRALVIFIGVGNLSE